MLATTHGRYLFGFACAALILVAVGVGTLLAAARLHSDNARVGHTYEVITRIEQARARLFDAVATQRNFLLTGEDQYRRQYLALRPMLERELAALATLVRDNPRQRQRAAQLGELADARLRRTDLSLAVFARQGLDAARQDIRRNNGRALTERFQALVTQMEAEERALLARRTEATRRSTWLLRGLGVLGIPLSLAILGWIYVLLAREVRDRQQAMRESADANVRLADSVRDLERASSDLRTLARCGSLLQSSRNMPEALDVVRRTLSALLPQAAGTIYLLRESQSHAEAESSWGTPQAASDPVLQPHDCWALRRGQAYVLEDVANGLACAHIQASDANPTDVTIACACLPLTAQGVTLGLLYLSAPAASLVPHMTTVATAAEQLSLALGNLRLQETLRHQSIRDPLTGLYNRRYLEESLARELARCERRGLPLALLMLDLDHFKALNDRHGHDGGDAVLSAFGRLLQASCRAEDIACRYGGEEFTLILPETGIDSAQRRAEQIRAAVADLRVQHLQSDMGEITVSVGIAVHPDHATSSHLLKRLADEALYRAKHEGRNRVAVARID